MTNNEIKEKLVQAYHILAYLGYDDHTYTHLSSLCTEKNAFFIYPFGLRFEEVTAQTLIKAAFDGAILEGNEFQYNQTGYMIHGSIYNKRPDIQSIFHIHTPEIVAVSAMKEGLLPISQWALHFYNQVAYHAYGSLVLSANQGDGLLKDLGDKYTMLLRNHGSITCGKTIEEALFYTYHLQQACKTQCLALAMNQALILPSPAVCEQAARDLLTFEKDLGKRDWAAWVRAIGKKEHQESFYTQYK